MRWERLFDDLEAAIQARDQGEVRAEVADRTRRERATVTILGRLAAQNDPIELLLVGGGVWRESRWMWEWTSSSSPTPPSAGSCR